jgi:Ca2+-binding RTX toxin-like protein
MGDGNDTFIWNPGDGSDTVEGQVGNDTIRFNCANINEHLDLSANGSRLRLTRDVANITMDADGVETVTLPTLGGVDNITVNSLVGTAVTQVNVDLAGIAGTTNGHGDSKWNFWPRHLQRRRQRNCCGSHQRWCRRPGSRHERGTGQ